MTLQFNPITGIFDLTSPDATATIKGVVQLAGDLAGGTAAAPTLTAIVVAATVGSSSAIPVITYDTKGRITSTTTAAPTGSKTFAFWAS